jgi:DNA ligase (NAD+)
MPPTCPSCRSAVAHVEGEVAIRCLHPECPEQILRKIIFFASKDAMDIGHLGEKVVEQLFSKGLIVRSSDLYALTKDNLSKLEGFKEKSIDNLLQSIENSKECSLSRFILALGIKYVGEGTAEALAQAALSLEKLSAMTQEELKEVEGVGGKVAEAVFEFFANPHNQAEVQNLLKMGVYPKVLSLSADPSHVFYGKTFVLTGTLQNYTRSQASNLIKERGGKIAATVSAKIDYLLCGEDPGSKWEKAKKLKVFVLSEEEFQKIL